eukprot:gene12640-16948_t
MGSGFSIKPEIFVLAKEEYETKKSSGLNDEDLFNHLTKFIEEKTAELQINTSKEKEKASSKDVAVEAVEADCQITPGNNKVYYTTRKLKTRYGARCWIPAEVITVNKHDLTMELRYDSKRNSNFMAQIEDVMVQNVIKEMGKANKKDVFLRWDESVIPSNPIHNTKATTHYEGFAGSNQDNYGPEMWGITRNQLSDILKDERFSGDMSMYDVVKSIVIPDTKGKGLGYALLKNREKPLRVRVMISHAWTESYSQFVSAICESEIEGPYWICAFAIYQPEDIPEVSIAKQLGTDPMRGPFATVLNQKETELMLAVITQQCDIYTRLWCVFEIFVAIQINLPVHVATFAENTGYGGSDQLYHNAIVESSLIAVDSRKARCGNPAKPPNMDELTIRSVIESIDGGYNTIDRVAEWVKFNSLLKIYEQEPWTKETMFMTPIGMSGPCAEMRSKLNNAMANYLQRI